MAYIVPQDLEVEGISCDEYGGTDFLEARIAVAQDFIEQLTGCVFEKKAAFVLRMDGTGHDTLYLPIPPISDSSITEVKIKTEVVTATDYEYPLRTIPDDRRNPRLIRLSTSTSIAATGIWPKGTLNITITGDFGFVESDESTPPLIKYLCTRIAIWDIKKMGDDPGKNASAIIEEELGDYRYKLSDKLVSSGGFFGDSKIDNIIAMYKKTGMRVL